MVGTPFVLDVPPHYPLGQKKSRLWDEKLTRLSGKSACAKGWTTFCFMFYLGYFPVLSGLEGLLNLAQA